MMTPQLSTHARSEGIGGIHSDKSNSALDLLVALGALVLGGRQMFERDCLSFTFDCWRQIHEGNPVPEMDRVTAADVFADIADIRALPATHPAEVDEVEPEFLALVTDIEEYVRRNAPTLQ
ncbi:hypothetical protein [Erythrobacter aureus]|uniref:Uncharacterized protein n=1 Tax=Erythrobacter aureus TaxID=2182384 RepID=A0A345YJG1_9SPHN|nr:hypothetical protein [Erythrobacter aureus]AXK44063.1 hypothetical protein DVR09_16555 [Erythrobacter aureus]